MGYHSIMEFEWDEDKNRINIEKHCIDFEVAQVIFNHATLTEIDDKADYGEIREISYGKLGNGVILTIVHTEREGKIRLISARKASREERRKYYEFERKDT